MKKFEFYRHLAAERGVELSMDLMKEADELYKEVCTHRWQRTTGTNDVCNICYKTRPGQLPRRPKPPMEQLPQALKELKRARKAYEDAKKRVMELQKKIESEKE